jgi:RNA polymerase sigma factor (sigma-70 family)
MDTRGDQYYIKEVNSGNTPAFRYLVEKYQDRVFNLALRICGSREDAEEIAQDAFMKSFRSLKGFRMQSSFSTWLYRIVYNTAITHLRGTRKNTVSIDEFPASFPDFREGNKSEMEAEKEYRNALINFALQKLSEADRGLIALHYFEELNIDEVADATGISKSNVKVRLFRARARMLEVLQNVDKKNAVCHEQ